MELQGIQNKIYEIRGNRVMLDFDHLTQQTIHLNETRTTNKRQ